MLIVHDNAVELLGQSIVHATRIGKLSQLLELLHRLDNWDRGNHYTGLEYPSSRCELYNDNTPYGFGFVVKRLVGIDQEGGPDYQFDFNGGLLYHGSRDGHGSGAGPTFTVTLNPHDGWAIHT